MSNHSIPPLTRTLRLIQAPSTLPSGTPAQTPAQRAVIARGQIIPAPSQTLSQTLGQVSGQTIKTAEVTGIVGKVDYSTNRGDPTRFRIYCPGVQQSFDAVCGLYCPIREGDTIYALCTIGPDGRLHISRPPFVQPPIDRNSTIQCLMRALKQSFINATRIYTKISRFAGGDEAMIPFLSGIAQSWHDTRNSEILFLFVGLDPEQIKELLNWWHQHRNLRRLYLFGLTNKEINASRMTCDQIYERCMTNPYTLPALGLDKCDQILDRLNKRPDPSDRFRGSIIRVMWENLHRNAWTGTPSRFLARQFPGIKDHVEILKRDYGLVAELETAYLQFPHRVEVWLANYLARLRQNDPVNYETPLDQPLPDGRERLSAHYTREMSEDQQRAIQGALDHNLSIVTGAAGTGKCLKLGTLVLMADGHPRPIEAIQPGEAVMGPDSRPRVVWSTCRGVDQMFEIKPKYGRSFICNTPHVLTLHGSYPKIRDRIVQFTRRGERHQMHFETPEAAETYLASLSPDIFDVPLDQYLTWSPAIQKRCHLFHVGVEYPTRFIERLPYDLGRDASDGIPDAYLRNNRQIRFEVLAGVLDKHGGTEWRGIGVNISDSTLRADVETLALSLGLMVDPKGDHLRIWGRELSLLPSRMFHFTPSFFANQNTLVRFKVQGVGIDQYAGFVLENSDGRFLLSDFTVTHNTSCIGQIIHNLELRGTTYALCAFTGKAVARIREVTRKRTPSTIHRLIANTRKSDLTKYANKFEQDIPLVEYEHVIIDEASMVKAELLYDFLQAYPKIKRLTLVGDANQLEPIEWGSVFAQMIKSETVPVYRLTTNYRVYTVDGERDGIILNANALIHHDPVYPFEFIPTTNFSMIEGPIERVYDILSGCFAGGIRPEQLVIISPQNQHLDQLNTEFQKIYNVGARFVTDSRGVKWMIGDRVMLTQNDANIGIFNGESGKVRDITPQAILIDFGHHGCHEFLLEPTQEAQRYPQRSQGVTQTYVHQGRPAESVFEGDDGEIERELTVKKLKHAYAITVDKSQGSEWDFVIFYVPEINSGSFLHCNRIYTALTRAKRCCWVVVSNLEAFQMVAVTRPPFRCENLSKRLTQQLPNLKPFRLHNPMLAIQMTGDLPILPDGMTPDVPDDAFDFGIDYDDFD